MVWKPGQSGNPRGRPRGSRAKLGEDFIGALYADFQAHGVAAIQRVRKEKPEQYLKVIAALVPRQLNISTDPLKDASDDELVQLLDFVRNATQSTKQGRSH